MQNARTRISKSVLFLVVASVLLVFSGGAFATPDPQLLGHLNNGDHDTYELLLKKAIHAAVQKAAHFYGFKSEVAETVFERAKTDINYYFEFDDIVEAAVKFPRDNFNPENDAKWLHTYFSYLSDVILDADPNKTGLRDEHSFFTYINMARKIHLDAGYARTLSQVTHKGDQEHRRLFRKVTDALAKLAPTTDNYSSDDLAVMISQGLYISSYAADGSHLERLKSFVDAIQVYVNEFEKGPTKDLMENVRNTSREIWEQITHEVHDRLLAGSVSEYDFALSKLYDYFGTSKYSVSAAIVALSANPEVQKNLAVAYYRWKTKNDIIGLVAANEPDTFRLLVKNLDNWFTPEEQTAFVKRYISNFTIRPEFAAVGSAYMNSHWGIIRKVMEDFHAQNPYTSGSVVSPDFILEHMKYEGTNDQKAVVDFLIKNGSSWLPETRTAFQKFFQRIDDPVQVTRWKRGISIFYYANREIFLDNPRGGLCSFLFNKLFPGVARAVYSR